MHRTLPPDPTQDRRRLAAGWRLVRVDVDDAGQPWVTWEPDPCTNSEREQSPNPPD